MDNLEQIITGIAGLFGVGIGYLIGYRSGSVAGELAALKSQRHRRPRDHRSSKGHESPRSSEPADHEDDD